jgi:hypothetical protein
MKKLWIMTLAVATALAIAPAAKADTYYFNFYGLGVSGSGSLTGNGLGGGEWNITGGTFIINGVSAGVVNNPTPGAASVSGDGGIYYDNILIPAGSPAVTGNGLLFIIGSGATAEEFNIWSQGGVTYFDEYYEGAWLDNGENGVPIVLNISSTPEPSTWLLLGTGILALAAGLFLKPRARTMQPGSIRAA